MNFYNTTDQENSLVHECWDLCDADNASYPFDPTVVRRFNIAIEQVIAWILEADGLWQWDDTNYSDLPIGTQTLVNSQSAYSFNDKFLEIQEVQILDVNGNWRIIKPIDQKEYSDLTPLSEAFKNDGFPIYYDKVSDDTIKLYPAPDNGVSVTLASGLKIKYRRTADKFTTSDTTQEPGFASPYHVILAYMAAIPYCMTYKKDRIIMYERKIIELKKELIEHYSRREQDKIKQVTFHQTLWR